LVYTVQAGKTFYLGRFMSFSHTSKTVSEILSQPDCWTRSLEAIARWSTAEAVRTHSAQAAEWLFIGCGTSYYLAQAAAATHSALTGTPARAVPASELFLYPELTLRTGQRFLPVLISRSGQTSEVLRAAEFLKARSVKSLAITCDGNKLSELADWTIKLPVHEESTVMTSSFTSMLLGLQYLSGHLAGNQRFLEGLRTLPPSLTKLLERDVERTEEFVRQHSFADYVYLGQGPFVGIAAEAALKVMESSSSYAQSFHTMEFRHGPKSIVSPTTMIGYFLSQSSYAEEVKVLQEMHRLGGIIFAVTNRADELVRRHSHLLIELGLDAPELCQLAPAIVWGQLLGVLTGIQKGLNPDSPRNLTRAVLLGE
jgi:glucosamine--fructose-6-phosphate aminotransferase (isomerizing)